MALQSEWSKNIPAVLRPLAAEEAEAAKDLPELQLDAASWVEEGQVWILELEPYQPETSPGGENLEEIHQSTSTERGDSENLAKGAADSESQSYEGKTVPLASQQGTETSCARHEWTHIRRKQEKSHLCEHCGQRFKRATDFILHMFTHPSEQPYGCTICGFRFKYQVQLKKHQKWHSGSCEMEEKEVELGEKDHNSQDVHGQRLPDKSIPTVQLQRLNLQGFQEDNRSFASLKTCECGQRCTTASNSLGLLPQNSIWEIGISGVPHVLPLTQICECGYCGIDNGNFDMKPPEQPHIETGISASAELPLALPTESTVLRSPSEGHKSMSYMQRKTASPIHSWWSHAMAGQSQKKSCSLIYPDLPLEEDKKESFACPKCSKEFRLFYYLERHMAVHQPEKPYECPTCKMCFARHSYLLKHKRKHTTNLRHECPECGSFFTQASYLRKHMKRH
ncbi:zinc finger protein 471-like [Anolis sagrei]|uniref:zinc finger protein 471-like n=1 Tax=Anolis sagrei TaxID=38937 RepID=UPI0035209ACF